jgi:hypothetical protein
MQDGKYTTYPSGSGRGSRRRRRRRRARRRLLLVVVLVVVIAAVLALVVVARGRGDEDAGEAGESGALASAQPTPTVPLPEVWAASESDPVRVWVGGDSMGGELGISLEPLLQEAGVFRPVTFYKESTGICRYDFYDWGEQVETVMKKDRPHAAVIMMGTNDTQSVWQDGQWIPYGKMAWKQAYEQRVGEIMDTMLRGGARRVYWVGMPIMGEDWRNSRMRLINRIFQKQAEQRPGAEYIDVWHLCADADGGFDPSLRLSDGVHFTVEGQKLLATTVYEAILQDWMPTGSEQPGPSPSAPAVP